jgi:hypothetical protein
MFLPEMQNGMNFGTMTHEVFPVDINLSARLP